MTDNAGVNNIPAAADNEVCVLNHLINTTPITHLSPGQLNELFFTVCIERRLGCLVDPNN